MIRKRIWVSGDNLPSFTNHLQGGSGSLTRSLVDDYIYLSYANPNPYLYVDMSSITDYVIQSGDFLEYDIYWETAGAIKIAMDLTASDGGTLRDSGAVDQNSLSTHPNTDISARAYGTWYHRKIPITTLSNGNSVGKTISYFDISCEIDGGSTYVGRIRNMAITDGNGLGLPRKIIKIDKSIAKRLENIGFTSELNNNPLFKDPSLIFYTRFEGNANDEKGLNNGTPTNVSFHRLYGKYGQGGYFNGSNAYITLPASASLNALGGATSSYTVCTWFLSGTSKDQSLSEKWTGTPYPWAFRGPNPNISFGLYDGTNNPTVFDTSKSWNNSVWNFAVGVRDKTANKVRLYMNGGLSGEVNDTTSNIANTGPVYIGARSSGGQFFNGYMDEFFIFNRALTAIEIVALYNYRIKKLLNISLS